MGVEQKGISILPQEGLIINSKMISFGISMDDVEYILGKPNKIYKTNEGNIRWQYYQYLIELSFEKEDEFKLGWIEVYNKYSTIYNHMFIGENIEQVIKYFNDKIMERPEFNDYGSFESYFYNKNWIELQVQFGNVTNINFGS